MQWRRPTTTSTPSINISSDQRADQRECSRLSRAHAKVDEGTTLAALRKPGLRPCAQRSSPQSVYPAPDWDLSARFASGADDSGSRHLRQTYHEPVSNRGGYPSPRGNRPTLLFPAGHLLRLHGDLYLAFPRRNGRTDSALSVSRPGKKGSPGGRKVSCRRPHRHRSLRDSRPCLLLFHV